MGFPVTSHVHLLKVFSILPIFVQLRNIWVDLIGSSRTIPSDVPHPSDPLVPTTPDNGPRSPASGILNPFASFVSSKALPSPELRKRHTIAGSYRPVATDVEDKPRSARIDVLSWLGRATLDAIGEAGKQLLTDSGLLDKNSLYARIWLLLQLSCIGGHGLRDRERARYGLWGHLQQCAQISRYHHPPGVVSYFAYLREFLVTFLCAP